MTVKVRPYLGQAGVFEVDIVLTLPNGKPFRQRVKAPMSSKSGARRWGEEREQFVLLNWQSEALTKKQKEEARIVPTLSGFREDFIKWCKAEKQKPSGVETKETQFRTHLVPLFGDRKLDSFTPKDELALKSRLLKRSASTYNNVATVLNKMLTVAAELKLIQAVPHRFRLLKRARGRPKFYDKPQYDRLVEAAAKISPQVHLTVLLGGDAGLRRGEIVGLEQTDCDFTSGQITVERSHWRGELTATKGMSYRVVPMTKRLQAALKKYRHLRGERVIYTSDGESPTDKVIKLWMAAAQRLANLKASGEIHILRHTFCSHLAMRGAPAKTIQELAGHEDLATTLQYMHLAKGEKERAIELLDAEGFGGILEEGSAAR